MTSRNSSTRRSTPSRRLHPRRLRGETLETRRVMAAAVDLSPDGLLVIEGDADNNRIWVAQSRSGERLRVSIDGRTKDFPAANISLMKIFAGPGNDAVKFGQSPGDGLGGVVGTALEGEEASRLAGLADDGDFHVVAHLGRVPYEGGMEEGAVEFGDGLLNLCPGGPVGFGQLAGGCHGVAGPDGTGFGVGVGRRAGGCI